MEEDKEKKRKRGGRWPKLVLVLDTETTTDKTQRFNFGCWRLYEWADEKQLKCVEEGLFYDDDLTNRTSAGLTTLKRYTRTELAATAPDESNILELLPTKEFLKQVFYPVAYRAKALVVGFNLPFDLSRLAAEVGPGRRGFLGGFSFVPWVYWDSTKGKYRPHKYRPRLGVKHIDNKRSFIGFTKRKEDDETDDQDQDDVFRGRFLDVRTLTFALTNEGYTLQGACDAFGVLHGKQKVKSHGKITKRYIDYNRRDVQATAELLEKLREEFDRHPIKLDPCKAFSPASIAKAYLHAMGVVPPVKKYADFPKEAIAAAMIAYYGGRAECRIRHSIVPVVLLDFLSMYPTVNFLLGLWELLTAGDLVVEDATDDVNRILTSVTAETCFDAAFWKELRCFVKITPDKDIVPVRAQYDLPHREFTIGVNEFSSEYPVWYALPDLVASTLITGRSPKVIEAFRLVPKRRQPKLQQVKLRGDVTVKPYSDDFFRSVIESRKRIQHDESRPEAERKRIELFLKVVANGGSYGVYAERNRQEPRAGKHDPILVHGLDDAPFESKTTAFEEPGEYSFPPFAALTTSCARLMLALLEHCVADKCGTYAFGDTDSMAIVATKPGGLVPCPGGPYRTSDGIPALHALSWVELDQIRRRFDSLNPYDPTAVSDPVLELEKENYSKTSKRRKELFAYVISAKRYVLFNLDRGVPVIRKPLEHGLGHLLNPTDPEDESRDWISEVWETFVREALGLPTRQPKWATHPAMARLTVSSFRLYKPFGRAGKDIPYGERVKPFNFVLSPTVARVGYPKGTKIGRFHLIGDYDLRPGRWLDSRFWNIYAKDSYWWITTGIHADAETVHVKSYGTVIQEHHTHPEAKSAGPDGQPCGNRTVGLLSRRRIQLGSIVYIGKESNRLEEVEQGTVHDWEEVLDVHDDRVRDAWNTLIIPVLRHVPAARLSKAIDVSKETIKSYRNGRSRPRPKNMIKVLQAVMKEAKRIVKQRTASPEVIHDADRLLQSPILHVFGMPNAE